MRSVSSDSIHNDVSLYEASTAMRVVPVLAIPVLFYSLMRSRLARRGPVAAGARSLRQFAAAFVEKEMIEAPLVAWRCRITGHKVKCP